MSSLIETLEITDNPHGGDLTAACQMTGLQPEEILDFSASINPLGPPRNVENLFAGTFRYIKEYPDPNCRAFKQDLSKTLKLDVHNISVTNGSTELIYLLPHLMDSGKELLIVSPCFSEYERAFQLNNIPVRTLTLDPSDGFSFRMDQFLAQVRQIPSLGGIVLGNPNSPTGTFWDAKSLSPLVNFCQANSLFLFVDETFIDFANPEESLLTQFNRCHNLILIRSMTKFFSLPGLRLGFGIMSPKWVKKIESHRFPWSVNALAQVIGSAALREKEYPQETRDFIFQEKSFLLRGLKAFSSLEVFPSAANFILFRLLNGFENRAEDFYLKLLQNGILLRNCGNFRGLNKSYFRVAIKNRRENTILLSKIYEFFDSCSG